ncbi:MAG: GGDEF domain-containing protein [Gammaproteobacteria bacterium]|nr:GGDEF domain-containing protein [Gammaproteobacteria bacterium]MBU1624634.1 GGDEF domain-containing protein [Gammaproteobacteria bacterium]MBU1982478.1 GGDEF domain-containing protein [Gammaproteobacteria bacterium]
MQELDRDRALTAQNLLFHNVDFTSVAYMLERTTVRELAAGENLLQPEVPNTFLYLILEGELSVHLAAHQTVEHATLVAGECTGEISLVDGKNPSALVVAAKATRVLAVPHDTVWSLVDQSHDVARNLLAIIAGRMRNDNSALITSHNQRAQYEHQATVDALTGVHNRRWMSDAFPRVLHRCALNKQRSAVMVLDIDHFKKVNDSYGHLVGDAALKSLADIMQHNLRPHDLLVRYGGEEFAILLPDTALEDARAIAERLRKMVAANEVVSHGVAFKITVSSGIASIGEVAELETSFAQADEALYRAKEGGRNRVEIAA